MTDLILRPELLDLTPTGSVAPMAHSYDVGTRAWQPDPSEGWIASEVEKKTVEGDKVRLLFRLANGEVTLQINGHCAEHQR